MINSLDRVYGLNNFNTPDNRKNLYMISGTVLTYSGGLYENRLIRYSNIND